MPADTPIINASTLKRIAEISRLKLDEKEAKELQADLEDILSYFSRIAEIEAGGRELYYVRKIDAVHRKDAPEKRAGEAGRVRDQFVRKEDDYMIAPRSL